MHFECIWMLEILLCTFGYLRHFVYFGYFVRYFCVHLDTWDTLCTLGTLCSAEAQGESSELHKRETQPKPD